MAEANNPGTPQATPDGNPVNTQPASTPPASSTTPPASTPPVEEILNYTDFVLPEGYDLGASKEEVIAFAKEHKLTQASAQKLVDMGVSLSKTVIDNLVKAEADNRLKTRDAWIASLKADKDFGGEKFDENVNRAKRMVKILNDPELNKFLDGEQGYGDHPSLVKAFAKLDRMINAEANFIDGGTPSPKSLNAADVLFGDMFAKEQK